MLRDKDSKQSIQVTIRVRPLSEKQIYEDSRICVKLQQSNSLHLNAGNQIKKFTFDSICFNQSQQQIFNRVGRKCTVDCLEGYNCTIFAYGQTGAGKTYTMMGVNFENQSYYEQRGLIPRTMEFLFECIDRQRQNGVNFIIRCSFLEIYNEQIIDLLNKSNNNLQLREDTRKGVYVQGITEEIINRSQQAMEILYKGSKSRHVGSTFYNQTSSRSHSVFTMQIESKYTKNGVSNTKSRQFNFIDLAGSERTKQSTGERLKQGCNINKSLMNLASVINALSEVSQGKMQHVNYRNSKLTFLLKDSLGGNSKTNLIANISPATVFYQQTLSTLGFARRAKLIKRQKASINQDSSGNLDSMKNQIKRLKQEVISLMSRQSPADPTKVNQPQKPSQMTSIMHQYVEQEIDKQTKLQLQIIKLNDRIVQLQNGIRQYSNNQIHLRMIITVYQDKINRLKSIQKILYQNISNLDQNDDQTTVIISYFKNQRNNFIQQLENLRSQAENNKFLKSLLQQAKVIKQEGEDDSLKELLVKNTNFLNMIRAKLDQMRPQKIEFEFHSDYQKKMTMMEEQYSKRQEQYQQRVEQINLQIADYKSRNQQNQKLLQQAINGQIILQESINSHQENNTKLHRQLEQCKNKLKLQERQKETIKMKSDQAIAELRCELNERNDKISILRKENDSLKIKLEKCNANQNALKEQFQNLEDEKYKIDKVLLQNIQELKQYKNNLLKKQSEIALINNKLAQLIEQNQNLQIKNAKLQQIELQKEKSFKAKLQEIEKSHIQQMQSKFNECDQLKNKIMNNEESIKQLNDKVSSSSIQIQTITHQLNNAQQQYKDTIANKQQKLKQLIHLINQKQVNGNETVIELNQAKIDLINAHSQKQQTQAKYNKITEELKEKLYKEEVNTKNLQNKLNEQAQLYGLLSAQHQYKKKECFQINDTLSKIKTKATALLEEAKKGQDKIQELLKQIDLLKNKQKQLKNNILQVKNQLYVTQNNSIIEIDALKSQISLKDQQVQQLQKQHNKSKQRYQSNLQQLKKQIENNLQAYKNQEESYKKSTESHLQAKQKKLSELRQTLNEYQAKIKQMESRLQQANNQLTKNNELNLSLSSQVNILQDKNQQLNASSQQLQAQLNQLKINHQKQLEESQIVHNEQIDQKNQQIQSYMLQNQDLNTAIQQVRTQLKQLTDINKSLMAQITIKNDNYKELSQQKVKCHNELTSLNHELNTYKQKKEQFVKLAQSYQQKYVQASKQYEDLHQANKQLKQKYKEQQENKQCALSKIAACQGQITNARNQINKYITTISLLTQQNCGLNQQLTTQFNEKQALQLSISNMEAQNNRIKSSLSAQKHQITKQNNDLSNQLQNMQNINKQNKQKIHELNQLTSQLTESMESGRLAAAHLLATKQSLEQHINTLEADLKHRAQQLISTRSELDQSTNKRTNLSLELSKMLQKYEKGAKSYNQLDQKYANLQKQYECLDIKLSQANTQISSKDKQLAQAKQRQVRQINKKNAQFNKLMQQVKKKSLQLINLNTSLTEITLQNSKNQQKVNKFQIHHQKLNAQLEQLHVFKQKWQLQKNQLEKIKNHIQEEKASKQRIYNQLCRQKDNCNNLKMLIENKSDQNMQLQRQLQQKDVIYKKLVEKIAKNENENKKTTNSQHYLKTIQLLEKSRAEQIELRRQNQELKKVMMTMKESIEQKEAAARQVEQRSETYCVSMHKRLQEIQNDYVELQRNHEKLIKERKNYSHDNEQLKEEIKNLKISAGKIAQKNEEMQSKIKKANLDYIHLQKEYEQLKKNDSIIPINTDEKTVYINRLKAEVAALKTEKVLLTETLNKERQEKTKLKAEMRYGKDGNNDLTMKIQLQKKINQNKNLTELIFEIISQLKICVNEPKAKLEVIRSIILGAIKEKNTEIKTLKEKMKQCETQHYRQIPKVDYNAVRENRQIKALSISNANRHPQEAYKFEKQKDPSFLTNNSRQKMKQFQKYYAKFKYNDGQNKEKGKNV